jgi:threonine synthase
MYFEQQFPPEFKIKPQTELINTPSYIHPKDLKRVPAPGKPLNEKDFKIFIGRVSEEIAGLLELKKR